MANANPIHAGNPTSTADAPKVDDNGVPAADAPEALTFPRTVKVDSHKATRTDW